MTRLILVAGLSMGFVAGLMSLPRTETFGVVPPLEMAVR